MQSSEFLLESCLARAATDRCRVSEGPELGSEDWQFPCDQMFQTLEVCSVLHTGPICTLQKKTLRLSEFPVILLSDVLYWLDFCFLTESVLEGEMLQKHSLVWITDPHSPSDPSFWLSFLIPDSIPQSPSINPGRTAGLVYMSSYLTNSTCLMSLFQHCSFQKKGIGGRCELYPVMYYYPRTVVMERMSLIMWLLSLEAACWTVEEKIECLNT